MHRCSCETGDASYSFSYNFSIVTCRGDSWLRIPIKVVFMVGKGDAESLSPTPTHWCYRHGPILVLRELDRAHQLGAVSRLTYSISRVCNIFCCMRCYSVFRYCKIVTLLGSEPMWCVLWVLKMDQFYLYRFSL